MNLKTCDNPKCQNFTTNPKYCSRSCSAIHTNTTNPKRKTKKRCIVCNKPVKSYRHNRCEKHHEDYLENKYLERTIGPNKTLEREQLPRTSTSQIRVYFFSKVKYLAKVVLHTTRRAESLLFDLLHPNPPSL